MADVAEDRALEDWASRRYPQAIAGWEQLIAANPGTRRYRIGLVRTLVSAGDIARARQELQAAKTVAATSRSDEYDYLVAEGEVLDAEQQDEAATQAFAAAADVIGRNAPSRPRSGLAGGTQKRPWHFNTGVVIDYFDNERNFENQLLYQLGYRFSPELLAFALYERHNRFDAFDPVYLVGIATRPFDALAARLSVGGSPDADFRPRTEASINLEWSMIDRVHPLLGYEFLDYPEGHVSTVTPGLRIVDSPLGDVELQYALTKEIDGSHSRIGGLRFDWRLGRQWLPSLSYQRGHEALPPQIRAKFQRTAAGLTWVASREWQLRLDYAYEDREDAYIGHSVAVGVGLDF